MSRPRRSRAAGRSVRPGARRPARGRALARMDGPRRGGDLRRARSAAARDAGETGRQTRASSTISSPTSSTNCARGPMSSSSSPAAISCAPGRVSPRRSGRRAPGMLRDAGAPELTPTELLAVTAIAYLQPATRAEISRLAGREISRDVIARLKRLDLIDAGLRAPEPGAPFAYVTTKKFLEVFGLGDAARPPGHRTARGRRPAAAAANRGGARRRLWPFRRGRLGIRRRRARRRQRRHLASRPAFSLFRCARTAP